MPDINENLKNHQEAINAIATGLEAVAGKSRAALQSATQSLQMAQQAKAATDQLTAQTQQSLQMAQQAKAATDRIAAQSQANAQKNDSQDERIKGLESSVSSAPAGVDATVPAQRIAALARLGN